MQINHRLVPPYLEGGTKNLKYDFEPVTFDLWRNSLRALPRSQCPLPNGTIKKILKILTFSHSPFSHEVNTRLKETMECLTFMTLTCLLDIWILDHRMMHLFVFCYCLQPNI